MGGLRHTTELFTQDVTCGRTDPLPDTPECQDVLAFGASCPDYDNLVFPLLPSGRRSEEVELSTQQGWVLRRNPLVRPHLAP